MAYQADEKKIAENMRRLLDKLKDDFDLPLITDTYSEYQSYYDGDKPWTKIQISKITALFSNVKPIDVINGTLPDELAVRTQTFKLRYLDKYLKDEKGLTLARAVSASEKSVNSMLSGEKLPSNAFLARVAAYFFLPVKMFTSDAETLPEYENLQVDEEVCAIQRHDLEATMAQLKHKHYVRRNYALLSHSLRVKLFVTLAVIIIPLIAFTVVSGTMIITDRTDALSAYTRDSEPMLYDINDSDQSQYHTNLEQSSKNSRPDAYYCDVYVGTRLHRIYNINASSSAYSAKLVLFFKFDRTEFHNMFLHYARNSLLGKIANDCNANPDIFKATPWSDEDSQTLAQWGAQNNSAVELWANMHASEYYPGETTSNNYIDKQTMFDIGNGDITADTFSYEKDIEYVDVIDGDGKPVFDEHGAARVTCYQRVILHADFNKAFDSPRYPLESVQFKMYIKPTMDAQYMRYIPDDSAVYSADGSSECISGFEPYFGISNGYRPLRETDSIKNFNMRLNYYRSVNTDPAVEYAHTYRTQLEIIVRANRSGISLFLQAFINIFSVVVWIVIAFYNQSYNNEDSIGMLGTGLFGIISAMIVGLSMMSDAGIVSLITLINIFTLAVIMIMTYQSIAAKRANVQKNRVMIAYNGIKLRIMFVALVVCTALMFFGLPLCAYLFML